MQRLMTDVEPFRGIGQQTGDLARRLVRQRCIYVVIVMLSSAGENDS